ncbi:MAG: adenylate/guanylate cyclase domain-containing protein [Granulosicoccaceae bacterium]|jgi:class 3 adenylate cyclase/CHASE2 domain-containing sensor protein
MKLSHSVVAAAFALATVLLLSLPVANRFESLSIDTLFWLRHQLYQIVPELQQQKESHVVVVAIDEETYQTEPFKATPKVMWTPQYAEVINRVFEADASVFGFDIVLPTSAQAYVPGYDKTFLQTLFKHRRSGKLVLGKVQHQSKPVAPFPAHSFAIGHHKNIRLLNLGTKHDDLEGIIRYLPLWFEAKNTDGSLRQDYSMSMELASRHLGMRHEEVNENTFKLGEHLIPSRDDAMLINFDTQPGAIPTYSLADLYACSQAGDTEYFRRHFANKIILLGTILDLEDRKLTSMRLTKEAEGHNVPERCRISYDEDKWASPYVREDQPGVYIHAQAINNLLEGNALGELNSFSYAALSLPLALLAALLTMNMTVLRSSATIGAAALIWIAIVLYAFHADLVLPLFDPLIASALCFAMLLAYRYTVTDKDKRLIKQAFGYYLEPAVIDDMMEGGSQPELGGEIRELTVWFSDIANYTNISEQLTAAELVEFLNKYFSAMTDIVKEHGGFVDKYVGDAIIAVFGAPLHDPEHALHAVQSAIACNKKLREIQNSFGLPAHLSVHARIGVNTGDMLVGNIGSYNRLNYTIMGDAVNLASRIEGVNKMYGTSVMVSDTTAEQCGERIAFRELDTVRVKGRETPVTLFEPLDEHNEKFAEAYREALADFRARNFQLAADKFSSLSQQGDVAAAKMQIRADAFVANPPPSDWDQINTLDSK